MRILYLSKPSFFDLDLSLVKELSKKVELFYLLDVSPFQSKSTALNIHLYPKSDIYEGLSYDELSVFKKYLKNAKTYIVNRVSNSSYNWSNIFLQYKIYKFIKRINPDLIHCNNYLDYNYLLFLIGNKYPILLTVHDPILHTGDSTVNNLIIRRINNLFIKKNILLNRFQKDEYIKLYKKNGNDVIVSSISIYDYLKDLQVEEIFPKKSILFFGRIAPYKGIEYLLEAFCNIEETHKDVELIIAGKGVYYFDTAKYLSNNKIKFINRYIDNPELVLLIKECHVVVCPYTDATQSGVIMCAYALNTPVIATRTGGIEEYVEHSSTGILIPPRNVAALSDALNLVLSNQEVVINMKKNIRAMYSFGKKSWKSIANDLVEVYKNNLERN